MAEVNVPKAIINISSGNEYANLNSSRGSSTSLNSNASSTTNSGKDFDPNEIKSTLSTSSAASSTGIDMLNSNDTKHYSIDDVWKSLNKDPKDFVRQLFENQQITVRQNLEQQELFRKVCLTGDSKDLQQDYQVEFLAVVSVMNTAAELRSILTLPATPELFSKQKSLCFSFLKLFKYHFQLAWDDPSFAFKSFGYLLAEEPNFFLLPFLKVLDFALQSQDRTFWKLRKLFVLLSSLCFLNKNLLDALTSNYCQKENIQLLKRISEPQEPDASQLFCNSDGPLTICHYFRWSLYFESNLCGPAALGNFLMEVSVNPNSSASLVTSLLSMIVIKRDLAAPLLSIDSHSSFISLASSYFASNERKEVIMFYSIHQPEFLKFISKLKSGFDMSSETKSLCDRFVKSLVWELVTHFSIKTLHELHFDGLIMESLTPFCLRILGTNTELNIESFVLTRDLFLPLFELINHNFKLDLREEPYLLCYLCLSLFTLNDYVTNSRDFTEIYRLLDDLGCKYSFNALLDHIQFFLSYNFNKYSLEDMRTAIPTPEYLKDRFGFDYIPPMSRENMFYENPLGLTSDVDFDMPHVFQKRKCMDLLKNCLFYCSIIRLRTYRVMTSVGNDTDFANLSSSQIDIDQTELYKYSRNSRYKLANFKNGFSMNYRLAYSALEVTVSSDLSFLTSCENLKFDDKRLAATLINVTADVQLSLSGIYGEFGLLSIFKLFLDFCRHDIRLANTSARVLADILPDEKDTSYESSRKRMLGETIEHSTLGSNLIRLFVEELDDGKTSYFKRLINFLKAYPSSLKPKKRVKGTMILDLQDYNRTLKTKQSLQDQLI
ncbi:hypothetical protein FOA43_004159 [Brettanomyces nanus]|uniref:Uncharacterized protein n=1 Tax=Eeniella nana TaxID=13502 RepID=A0A875S9D9_EENNA|nr:uncharacterized protein FOA43_004159 [Brettanomyces nanus]QPG76765.1 hypothetical protein FOA43_004159 [Brettanomyces nanus]